MTDRSPRIGHPSRSIPSIVVAGLLATVLVGCGTAAPSTLPSTTGTSGANMPALSLANVKTETAAARGALIPRAGGSVSATGSSGVVYTLTVPPGALSADTNVGLYPVTAIDQLVKGGSLVGGVQFTPDGTELEFPATLTVQVPAELDLSHVVGFAYSGDAADPALRPALVSGRTITILVRHFSGIGASKTYGDLLGVWGGQAVWQQAIFQEIEKPDRSMATIADILRTQYNEVVRPALGACTNVEAAPFAAGSPCDLDGNKPAEAQWAYEEWRDALLYVQIQFSDFTVEPELAQSKVLAATHLQDWYGALNDRCRSLAGNSIAGDGPDNPIRWAGQALAHVADWATEWGIATTNGLDLESLLDHLCAKVVIDPARSYAASQPGETGTLSVNAGVTIETAANVAGPVRHDLPIDIKATGAGADAIGTTDSQGDYHVELAWPDGLDPLKIDILASIHVENPNVQRIASFDRITKSSRTSDILFADLKQRLFTIDPHGEHLTAIDVRVPVFDPAWSPDRKNIAFVQPSVGLIVANADGSGVRTVVQGTNPREPAWSPDGKHIAVYRFSGAKQVVSIVGADGSDLHDLPLGPQAAFPTWSPDGKQIAFLGSDASGAGIWKVNVDGSEPARLIGGFTGGLDWSPVDDSLAIAQTSAEGSRIAIVDAVGGATRALTTYQGQAGIADSSPVFSPDGSQIVFVRFTAPSVTDSGSAEYDLYVVNVDGSGLTQLTHSGDVRFADW